MVYNNDCLCYYNYTNLRCKDFLMYVYVFGTVYWDCPQKAKEKSSYLTEWKRRVCEYIPDISKLYMSSGTYSNPKDSPLPDTELIQLNIPITIKHSNDWNYWRVAFINGIFNALLSKDKVDLIIHCQTNLFLGVNLESMIKAFMRSEKIVMTVRVNSLWGKGLETGIMIMKPKAAIKYITQGLRSSLSTKKELNVELEAFELFKGEWFNLLPAATTIRKEIVESCEKINPENKVIIERGFNLSDQQFINLPFILGPKHCSLEDYNRWIQNHPIKK